MSFRGLSFRARLTLVAASAVALAVVVGSLVTLLVVRNQLRGQVDTTLQNRATEIARGGRLHVEGGYLEGVPPEPLGFGDYVQLVTPDGDTVRTRFESGSLPPGKAGRDAARGRGRATFGDAKLGGTDYRVFTIPVRDPVSGTTYALQVARSLSEVDRTLHRITFLLLLVALGGVAVAAGLGLAVSRAALAPVRRLTLATENVRETGDLSERIPDLSLIHI